MQLVLAHRAREEALIIDAEDAENLQGLLPMANAVYYDFSRPPPSPGTTPFAVSTAMTSR